MVKITEIDVKKRGLTINFDDGTSLLVSPETKDEFLLYTGKELTTQELAKLKSYEANVEHFNYTLRLLARQAYTAYEIKEKLTKRHVIEPNISNIIKRLEAIDLINDKRYARERASYLINTKKASQKAVQKELKRRGINTFTITDVLSTIPYFEIALINARLIKIVRRYQKESIYVARSKIIQKLYGEGYERENIMSALQDFPLTTYIDEDANITLALQKIYRQIQTKDVNTHKLVYTKLMKAGYPRDKIMNILEGITHEN